ncbi:conjugal transfer protein TrbH [Agrobacterium sp. V1]|uniref:conjugal transfer protein TrbH n=1 Tax=Agrobacterium sp. V1 TaxID=3061957 RepID=UPI002673C659|nr:conjugal transfer protein TrbH [Agrobacterium sp. V1]MDO3445443.1 conjugal transfer protein TrbH [Agrobacterium sp. V1]
MNRTIVAFFLSTVLSGCQTAAETPPAGSTPITMSGATANAIAGDMASRFAEQVRPAGATILRMETDASDYALALATALKGWGYIVIDEGKTEKDQKPVEIAWSIDNFDGQVLARISTPAIALGRAYSATPTGATPASPLSILQRS